MATREDLEGWLIQALTLSGGRGSIVGLCKKIWEQHEPELRNSGDLLYIRGSMTYDGPRTGFAAEKS